MNILIIGAIYALIAAGFYGMYTDSADEQDVKAAIIWPAAVGILLANELNKAESGDSKFEKK